MLTAGSFIEEVLFENYTQIEKRTSSEGRLNWKRPGNGQLQVHQKVKMNCGFLNFNMNSTHMGGVWARMITSALFQKHSRQTDELLRTYDRSRGFL